MNCQDAQKQIYMYLDGELTSSLEEQLLAHVADCPACAAVFTEGAALDALLTDQMALTDAPVGFADQVMRSLPAQQSADLLQFGQMPRRNKMILRLSSMAAAVLLLIGGLVAYNILQNPTVDIADGPQVNNLPVVAPVEPQPAEPTPDQTIEPIEEKIPVAPSVAPPPVVTAEEDQNAQVELPKVAYSSRQEVAFSQNLLACYDGADIFAATLTDEGNVQYYVSYKGKYHCWQISPDKAEDPSLVDLYTNPPYQWQGVSSFAQEDGLVAISPDGMMVAGSFGTAEEAALWLSDNNAEADPVQIAGVGGGKILCWSKDSNKLVFSDEKGSLYIVYPLEKIVILVFEGQVSDAFWNVDGDQVIFTGKAAGEDNYSLYATIVP